MSQTGVLHKNGNPFSAISAYQQIAADRCRFSTAKLVLKFDPLVDMFSLEIEGITRGIKILNIHNGREITAVFDVPE